MKISVNDKELFTLSDVQKKVIQNDINSDDFETDMKRRLQYILTHKYEQCRERLINEWMPRLRERTKSIPTDYDELCKLIFAQKDYKSRKEREL